MGPVNTVNFNAVYINGKTTERHVIECERNKVAKEIARRFGINIKDVTIFRIEGDRKIRVSPHDIQNFMRIEIIQKKNGQKATQSSVEIEFLTKMVESITSKLRQNTSLSGQERRALIEALETHSTAIFKKRKLDQTDIETPTSTEKPKPPVCNKKLQVKLQVQDVKEVRDVNMKESFCQTDPLNIPCAESPGIEDDDVGDEDDHQKLRRLCAYERKPEKEIDSLMDKTFEKRRTYIINEMPRVLSVKERYPALFCTKQVRKEFDRIFYHGKCKEFLTNMATYAKHILYYKDDIEEEFVGTFEKACSHARTQVQKIYADMVGSIFVLASMLKENFGFIHLKDIPHSSNDEYPYIDASLYSLNEIFFDDVVFHIIVEGQHLCEAPNFPEAILYLLAAYFIFNIQFPESSKRTLTVLEHAYLKSYEKLEGDDETLQMIKILLLKSKNNIQSKENAPRTHYLRS